MLYKKFNIVRYRAIDNADVEINRNQIVPIIGINESGKTSILQSILAFDKTKDRTNRGQHLVYKNKYKLGTTDSLIRAFIVFENDKEIDGLIDAIRPKQSDAGVVRKTLRDFLNKKGCLVINRNLSSKKYSVEDIEFEDRYEKRLIKHVLENLPYILYFDDFSDRVPDQITFSPEYSGSSSIDKRSQIAEWQQLIEEIVKRSTNGEYTLKKFFEIADQEDDQQNLLYDINDVLNKEIIEEWKNLKKKGRTFADDGDLDLELKLNFIPWDTGERSFKFKVVDKSNDSRSREFNVTERSKGFQWFFNFTVKLKFNSRYKADNPAGAIYLLDEPGSYLHASAQDELLKELKDISTTNTILYCTHSQHLLNPDVINVGTIRIAEKKNASILLYLFGSYPKSKSAGALAPLYDALRMKIPLSSVDKERIFITEGIVEYYLFKMLAEYSDLISIPSVSIVPGAGAHNLKDLISLTIASTDRFLVAFDNDLAGQEAEKQYRSYFGDDIANHFFFYGPENSSQKFTLEQYFSLNDSNRIKKITNSTNVKSSIIRLFYLEENEKKMFFDNLDGLTKKNFEPVFAKLKALENSKQRKNLILR